MRGVEPEGGIDVDFSGEFRDLSEFNKEGLKSYIVNFLSKYGELKEIFEVSVYLKKFDATYFGKPLIFCSLAANTEFGLVSASSTGWGLKQSLRQSLKSLILDMHKLNERELYGKYSEAIA